MRRVLTAMALLLGLPLSVAACLWDRDTPVDEARGLPEVVAVLTGRFERNPPLFYEMRLERVAAHLRSHPGTSPPTTTPGSPATASGAATRRSPGWRRSGSNCPGATPRDPEVQGAVLPLSREPRHVPRPPMGAAGGRSGEDRRGQGGARRDRQGHGDQPERALRPREIPVAGAGMDHRPAEGRGLAAGPPEPPRLELR